MSQAPTVSSAPARLASLDAYRGFVMLLMMAESLHFAGLAKRFPNSPLCAMLAYHQTHVEWIGCSLHDLIQPSFSFLVGVALPFSLASRRAKGQSTLFMSLHAFWRALVLVALGIFLRSVGHSQTNFTFEDTLTQIGLGYGFLFLLALRPMRDQWIAVALIVVGYWAAFALHPLPAADFDYARVGVSADWLKDHGLGGFAAHWNKNSNLAWAVDVWFLNLFPRVEKFVFNGGGYATLSFIPTLGTMILGLLAGRVLHGELPSAQSNARKLAWFVLAGAVGLMLGWLAGSLGICPVVKRIWTPSWVLFSGGCCFMLLVAFYAAFDLTKLQILAFPLRVIGANSIAAYMMAHLFEDFIRSALVCHLGAHLFASFGEQYQTTILGGCSLLVLWVILLWMYSKKIFVKV